MSPTAYLHLAPTSTLPRLRNAVDPDETSPERISSALRSLRDIYAPCRVQFASRRAPPTSKPPLPGSSCEAADYLSAPLTTSTTGTSTPLVVDSGYASGEEDEAEEKNKEEQDVLCTAAIVVAEQEQDDEHLARLRADAYEREFASRWLTTLIVRADEILLDIEDDDVRQQLVDEASLVLEMVSHSNRVREDDGGDAEEEGDAGAIVRDFQFPVQQVDDSTQVYSPVEVSLTDGTPARGADHTDVGLQSWGASIVVSALLCVKPRTFGLPLPKVPAAGPAPRIVELGAGTGLVGITLAKLLPRLGGEAEVIMTDYHPAVLANLRDNVLANAPDPAAADWPLVRTCLLDWSVPALPPLLQDRPADMLVATDVVYAPEHAEWLRDCAGRLLSRCSGADRGGTFWLVASVRPNGRFEGVTNTVEEAFADARACPRYLTDDGRLAMVLRILGVEHVEKKKGIGRADEVGYKIFRIGWQEETVEVGRG